MHCEDLSHHTHSWVPLYPMGNGLETSCDNLAHQVSTVPLVFFILHHGYRKSAFPCHVQRRFERLRPMRCEKCREEIEQKRFSYHSTSYTSYHSIHNNHYRSDSLRFCEDVFSFERQSSIPQIPTPYSLTPLAIDNLNVQHDPEARNFNVSSRFVGSSHHRVDEAWKQLLANMDIRVTRQELQRNGRTSISLPGGDYLAWLGVFHELHCVVGLSCGTISK